MNEPRISLKKVLTQISSEDLYTVFSAIEQDVLYILNPMGYFTALSPNFEKITGWETNEWIGRHIKDIIPPQDYRNAFKQLISLKQGKTPKPIELRIKAKNGICIGKFFTKPLFRGTKVVGIIGVAKDITIQKEQIDIHSKNQLIDIFQHVADGVTVQDSTGKLILVNEAAARSVGYTSSEEMLKNQTLWLKRYELKDELGKEFPVAMLPGSRILNGELKAEALFQFIDKVTRNDRWVIVKSRPIFDVMGKLNMVINIMHDVTKQKKSEDRKEEFMSMASHELKTPLTSINIYLDILKKRLSNQDNTNTIFISKIEKQMNKLMKLVADLLDITRIKAGKINYKMEQFDLGEVINEVVDPIREMNIKNNIKFKSTKKIYVYGDRYRINQVITNLLSNAIKYSPDGGDIKILLKENHNEAVISIKDQGIGIDPKHHKRIFEQMYQINENTERTFPGLGIGLYISAEIIKRHNGAIWVESNKGKGTTFSFSLLKTDIKPE